MSKSSDDDSRISPARIERVDQWVEVYKGKLKQAVEKHPEDYGFSTDEVPEVASRMRRSFVCGSYNHDSHAIKWTCKHFGIEHTRKAREEWFNSGLAKL